MQKLESQLQCRQDRICYYWEVIMGTHLGTHLEWAGYLRNKLGRVSRVRSALYLYNKKLLVGYYLSSSCGLTILITIFESICSTGAEVLILG